LLMTHSLDDMSMNGEEYSFSRMFVIGILERTEEVVGK